MNGIIHVCSHPDDDNVHFRMSEEDLFKSIFHYIEFLFRLIKPQGVFFMAVDGVAPRAKMNQQRSRRFRTAKAMEDQERAAKQRGEELPETQRFDSNAITPGTEFMVKLQENLKYFVMKKVSSDPLWRGVDVILSGHETPGEGEHKIMDFIRYQRSQPNYNANTRHCLYGLDADLIMLGLTSHEPNFCLLREEVRYDNKSKQKRANIPEEMRYYLLHLSLLREYIDHEFSDLKSLVRFPYDLERIIDDWILLGFLVGNDFVPHLPALHIHDDALPKLWAVYKQVLPQLDGYLHENGHITLDRFERYMAEVGKIDESSFDERYCDSKWLMGKRGHKTAEMLDSLKESPSKPETRGSRRCEGKVENQEEAMRQELRDEGLNEELLKLVPFDDYFEDADLDADESLQPRPLVPKAEQQVIEEDEEEGADTERRLFLREFRQYKSDYYAQKLGVVHPNQEWLRSQALEYVRALQWILRYYFEGVPSWSWFYPQHYAPFASDVRRFAELGPITMERSTPFLPFQQLMAVLPAGSSALLPAAYQRLMCEASSPIIDFYPVNFDTDLNGKKQEWEAVVLIPFIEEVRLISAMNSVDLLADEASRNRHGPHLLYRYCADAQPTLYPSSFPGVFPDLEACRVTRTELHKELHHVTRAELVTGRHPGVRPDLYYAGFPVLNNLQHQFKLERKGVKVFNYNSRDASMLLYIGEDGEEDVDEERGIVEEAKALVGREVLLQWPHLVEGLVVEVLSENWRCSLSGNEENNHHRFDKMRVDQKERNMFRTLSTSLIDKALLSRGINVGTTHYLVFAKLLAGRRHVVDSKGIVQLEKQWSSSPSVFLRQRCLQRLPLADSTAQKFDTVTELFPIGADVFSLAAGHSYGCMGEVTAHLDGKSSVQVKLTDVVDHDFRRLCQGEWKADDVYLLSQHVARELNVTSHFISRITGSIFLYRGSETQPSSDKINVGLNIKFSKACEEVLGFSKREPSTGPWSFSERTVEILQDYRAKFPELFNYISRHTSQDVYYEHQIMSDHPQRSEVMDKMKDFFDNLPTKKSQRVPHGNQQVSDDLVSRIVQEITTRRSEKKRTFTTQLKPNQLFRCVASQGYLLPERGETFDLLDRVVNIRPGCTVPLGLHGTIVGIMRNQRKGETENDPSLLMNAPATQTSAQDWNYEILFDSEFEKALPGPRSSGRLYRLPAYALINLTKGRQRRGQDIKDYQQSWNILRQQHHPAPRQQQRELWEQAQQSYGRERHRKGQNSEEDPQMAAAIAALSMIDVPVQRPMSAFSVPRRPKDRPGFQLLQQVCQHYSWPFPRVFPNFDASSGFFVVTIKFPNGYECMKWAQSEDDALFEIANNLWVSNNRAPNHYVHEDRRRQQGFVPLQVDRKKAPSRGKQEVRPVQQNQQPEPPQQSTVDRKQAEPQSHGETRRRGRRRIGANFPGAQKQ